MIGPTLYTGTLRHRRFHPREHAFTYSLFMSLIDIDRIAETMAASRLTSHNRFNVLSFDERDHLQGRGATLRERLAERAAADGERLPAGSIHLLTHLRYAGYVFNPISIYYCHGTSGALELVVADVRNTYGGRRQYWLRSGDATPRRFRAVVAKTLFVSPFMRDEMQYEFVLTPPGGPLVAHMNVNERASGRRCFDATLSLAPQPWTAAAIRQLAFKHPFMTAKVMGAIHWEAVRLRWKRVPELSPRPTN